MRKTNRPRLLLSCLLRQIGRRVKCGEERPECRRCTSTGRRCDGYANSQSSFSQTTQSSIITETLTRRPPTVPWYGLFTGDLERRSFRFFLEKTAPQLAGDFECPFWDYMVLQSVHQEPAIRHITVALGSLHENFEHDAALVHSSRLAAGGSFALRQYLSAMHCLMPTPTSSQPLDVCLISCILFAFFEVRSCKFDAVAMARCILTSDSRPCADTTHQPSRILPAG